MSAEANKALVRRFIEEVLAGGDFAVLAELTAPACVDHAPPPGQPSGPAGIAPLVIVWRAAFPDLAITIEDLIAEGDQVVVHATLRGTHRGDFFGLPPTGRTVAVGGLARYRLSSGRIVERWAIVDTLGLLEQLGVPSPVRRPGSVGGVRPLGPLQ